MGEGSERNSAAHSALSPFSVTSAATHKHTEPFWCWFPGGWVCVPSRTLWVSPTNSPVRLGISSTASTPQVFSVRGLRLYFLVLEPWVAQFVLLHSCSSQFICTQVWDCLLCQPLPCCPSPPLLPVWMNISLTPCCQVSIQFDFLSVLVVFLFLNLLSFFWLCKEAQCIYLRLHIGRKLLWPFVCAFCWKWSYYISD